MTESKTRCRLELPPGLRVRVPELGEKGEVLWSPVDASAGEVKVEETTDVVVMRRVLPIVRPVQGTFVRQWGTQGGGEGQFNQPVGVAVSGGEVFVSDLGNHRIQVFGLDGSFVRQWGTEGAGEGQFVGPSCVAVSGEEVIVCDRSNNRIQIFV